MKEVVITLQAPMIRIVPIRVELPQLVVLSRVLRQPPILPLVQNLRTQRRVKLVAPFLQDRSDGCIKGVVPDHGVASGVARTAPTWGRRGADWGLCCTGAR